MKQICPTNSNLIILSVYFTRAKLRNRKNHKNDSQQCKNNLLMSQLT